MSELAEQHPDSPAPQYRGNPLMPFLLSTATVQIQSVLFNNDTDALERSVASIARAAQLALREGIATQFDLRYGDCSPMPCLDSGALARLEQAADGVVRISYEYFAGNLGSARGHNQLAAGSAADFILVENPDVVLSPRLLCLLLASFRRAGIGMVEGKQLPIEHPKDYDATTGETSWASTACVMIPASLFHGLGGFDAESFFLYCDDVDFSWRVRLAGFRVIFQPAATLFHDKRLSREGKWMASLPERRYSAEASLMLAHKWSRLDLVTKLLAYFRQSPDDELVRAARVYDERQRTGRLPVPLDPQHRVGEFVDYGYAKHRFTL